MKLFQSSTCEFTEIGTYNHASVVCAFFNHGNTFCACYTCAFACAAASFTQAHVHIRRYLQSCKCSVRLFQSREYILRMLQMCVCMCGCIIHASTLCIYTKNPDDLRTCMLSVSFFKESSKHIQTSKSAPAQMTSCT